MEETQSQYLSQETQEWIRSRALSEGAVAADFAPLGRPLSFDIYQEWIAEGHNGEMAYLQRHLPEKENPQKRWPKMRSAAVLLVPYEKRSRTERLQAARTALYSQSQDYHERIPKRFANLMSELNQKFSNEAFVLVTDSTPIMERDLAFKAGLGWFGKNSCLIHRQKGSLFLIAEILMSFDLKQAAVTSVDHCGKCDKCIQACPTQAIQPNRTLDSKRCISYWTIESKTIPPLALAEKFNDWLFGCDICQTVCPWNEKAFGRKEMQLESLPRRSKTAELTDELRWILQVDAAEFKAAFAGSPVLRAKAQGLKRNALIVIGNLGLRELSPEVSNLDSDPFLGELARWTLSRLKKA